MNTDPNIDTVKPTQYDTSVAKLFGNSADTAPVSASAFTPSTDLFGGAHDLKKPYRDPETGTWKNGLGLETNETHKHVSVIWQRQCIPFNQFVAQVEQDATRKSDELKPESWVRFDSSLRLPDGTALTPFGLNTVAKYTNVPQAMVEYLVAMDNPIATADLVKYLNTELDSREVEWGGKHKDSRSFLLRRRADIKTGDSVVRAVLSERYGVIDNTAALDIIGSSFDRSAWGEALFSHGNDDGDNIMGNILIPDRCKNIPGDSEYGVGISFRNSEVGKLKFQVQPFLFRAICLNGCIWGRQNGELIIAKKHLGEINMVELRADVQRAVRAALNYGNDLLLQMGYTRDVKVNDVSRVIASLGNKEGLSSEKGKAWFEGYQTEVASGSPDRSAFSVVNGLTRAAQKFDGQARVEMETAAGNILTPDLSASRDLIAQYWGKAVDRSSDVSEKKALSYCGIQR